MNFALRALGVFFVFSLVFTSCKPKQKCAAYSDIPLGVELVDDSVTTETE